MLNSPEIFDRAEILLGAEVMERLAQTRVILFGVGGVGSWCAEALVRTGVGSLTIVDMDDVAPSNVNRQLPATTATIGEPKVEAMRRHLLEVNPQAEIAALQRRFTAESAADFDLGSYDFVVDAIDSVADKAELILLATSLGSKPKLVSSMGAARKTDPLRVQVREFADVRGCPLAAALRSRFKRIGRWPRRKFKAVFSDVVLPAPASGPNGSLMQITAVWGLVLASQIINAVARRQ